MMLEYNVEAGQLPGPAVLIQIMVEVNGYQKGKLFWKV
jgi:hypothetical protein